MENEKRLIDANDPLKQLSDYMEKLHCSTDYIDGLYRGMEIAESYIKNAPTVDAVEVVHARWVLRQDDGYEWYECSSCRAQPLNDNAERPVLSDYCPNCGAKMDGDGNDL